MHTCTYIVHVHVLKDYCSTQVQTGIKREPEKKVKRSAVGIQTCIPMHLKGLPNQDVTLHTRCGNMFKLGTFYKHYQLEYCA